MSFLVISSSLNSQSKSAILALEAMKHLQAQGKTVEWVDLRDVELPHCDGEKAYGHPNVAKMAAKIKEASCILVAVPIYNYDCGAAAKNLLELTGKAWTEKTVGFLCAAGGKSSYMSIMGFANSLMLDFRCLIIPRFVYTDGSAFKESQIIDKEISERIEQLVAAAIKYDTASTQ